jgi:TRAP-type C4-dicarboxylate transport system permease small subunit
MGRGGQEGLEALKKSGVKIVNANPAFVAEVQKRSAPIVDDWIKKASAKGVDAAKILAEFREELKKGRRREVSDATEERWKRRADVLLGAVASAILFAMMLLTVVDVVARYAFNRPLRGAFEVTELMLLVLIFAGLPLVSFSDEHAVMDFIDRVLGPRAQRWLERFVQLVNAAFMFLLTWLVWLKANRIWGYRDTTDVLRIVYGPFVYFMAGHPRPRGPDPPLQDARAPMIDSRPMIEGLVGLVAMMVLCCLRVPISFAMAIVGFVGYAYMRDWNWMVASATIQTKMYETGTQLHPVRGAPVHPHGQFRHARGHVPGALSRRLRVHRPPARRPRHGHRCGPPRASGASADRPSPPPPPSPRWPIPR